ncbi:sensor histidine kinase [Curtobacterium flaccumfaciens]|uniref:sensor histidine kinase n=1 Tax=Curtobacterium flaccumfaciens TaxID=2035 RepID=UPI001ADB6521|nr:ATP-binding protein [Curtobacterium flaccumfaciens]MBO9051629.1 ATP-binding protein [Curtobacterium flaccumfaciens pv. flaccumfaciens]
MGIVEPLQPHEAGLSFIVDARHVRQLGQQLVGDKVTALVELVKNAYDADATAVTLSFDLHARAWVDGEGSLLYSLADLPLKSGSSEIDFEAVTELPGLLVVEDNGSGMTLDVIRDSWMRIASSDKENNSQSPVFGRARAGRKGIGRFAAESLGAHLTMRTTVSGSENVYSVRFNWEQDYSAGRNLSEVRNALDQLPGAPEAQGVRLEIRGLHDKWTVAQRERVSRALLLLQPPFDPTIDRETFRVRMLVGKKEEVSAGIDDFLAGETARLHGWVDGNGAVHLRVDSTRLGLAREEVLPTRALLTGEFDLHSSYFVYLASAIGVPVRAAQEFAAQYGGIRVYRDNLRLLPYGERSDDWLGLDELSRRRVYLNPIGNQNYFAEVRLTRRENPLLEDMSSREGLLNNEAYDEFRQVVRELLITAAGWVAEQRARRSKGSSERKPSRTARTDNAAKVLERVEDSLRTRIHPADLPSVMLGIRASVSDVVARAAESDTQEVEQFRALQNEVELLRVLASLGTSVSVFSHEVRALIGGTSRALNRLESTAEVKDALDHVGSLGELSAYIDSLTSDARRREREPQAISEAIRRFVQNFAKQLANGVGVTWAVDPPSLRTEPMSMTTLQAILINLFTNAIKAVDREGVSDRRIHISGSASGSREIVLQVWDTGVGIPANLGDRIFDAFVTDTPVAGAELGIGTGLGLKVASDLAGEYGGSISIGEPGADFSTVLNVVLPRWEAQIER